MVLDKMVRKFFSAFPHHKERALLQVAAFKDPHWCGWVYSTIASRAFNSCEESHFQPFVAKICDFGSRQLHNRLFYRDKVHVVVLQLDFAAC